MNANMDNRGRIIVKLLALAALAATLVGCSRGSPEMAAVKDARAEYCRYLNDGWPESGRNMKFVASVRDAVTGVKDRKARVALVRSIAEDLERCGLTLDERGLKVLARRVSAYEAVLEMSMDLLFEEDDDIRMVVDRFFACMSKFREACFSIAQDRRGESESDKSFDARCQCVWSLMEDYAHAMRWWEMSLPRHLRRLPPALKEKYLERRKLFLNYESGRRLRERMMWTRASRFSSRGGGNTGRCAVLPMIAARSLPEKPRSARAEEGTAPDACGVRLRMTCAFSNERRCGISSRQFSCRMRIASGLLAFGTMR